MRRLGLLLVLLATPAGAGENLDLELIAEGVIAIRPNDAAWDAYRAISNSAAIFLDDGLLLYDSHLTPELVEEAKAELARYTPKPVRYVVNSHYHQDHTGGNWAYGPEVEIITHLATRERLLKYYGDLPSELPKEIAEAEASLSTLTDPALRVRAEAFLRLDRELLQRVQGGRKPPLPTLTFDSKVVLQRGKRVEIFFLGRGHTDGDAVLILPEQKVALLGDLLFNQALPNLQDGYTRDWIVTLEKILTLGAERFLPGHGPVVSADGVRDMIAYLVYLRGAVEPHVKAGRGLDEVKLRVKLPEAYASYRFRHLFPSNLEKVYQELKEGR